MFPETWLQGWGKRNNFHTTVLLQNVPDHLDIILSRITIANGDVSRITLFFPPTVWREVSMRLYKKKGKN